MAWIFRAILLLVVASELVSIIADREYLSAATQAKSLPFDLLNIAFASAALWVSFTPFFLRHWRSVVLALCLAVLAGIAAGNIAARETEPVVIATFLFVAGSCALIPWEAPWQMSLTAGCMITMGADLLLVPASDDYNPYRWIGMGTLAAIAYVSTIVKRELIAARKAALLASQAKSEFLSNMSHEIRTPMNAILGMAELLAETPLTAEQSRYVTTMNNNGAALLDLINSILDLAKIESGRLGLEETGFDLHELVDSLTETLAVRAHEKQLELVARIVPGTTTNLVGDPLRLRQVLANLLGNALKFTERGEVVLTVQNDVAPGALRFEVRDSGIGIPPDKLEAVFGSFTQADSSSTRKYGGSGLGLAIAKRLVELTGGRIWVESRPGHGSRFYFIARFGIRHSAQPDQPKLSVSLAGLPVLIVDDNPTNRLILCETLSSRGALISEADGGERALHEWRQARAASRPFRLIILDCRMPGMDGFEVARRLRRESTDCQPVILMLTSDDLDAKLSRLRECGLDAYLVKPVKRAELFRAITTAMGAGRRVQPAPQPPVAEQVAQRPLSILLAEDSPDNRLLIQHYLKRLPFVLEQAENGLVALEKFVRGHYDLVLMDMRMPTMDGYNAVRKIRDWERTQHRTPTPIIALTASALETDARNCLEAGCTAHLSKPVKKSNLLTAIQTLTQDGSNSAGEERPQSEQSAESPHLRNSWR